jgi:cell division protein WhiA
VCLAGKGGRETVSFAAQTKKELTLISEPPCCQLTELGVMMTLNGTMRMTDGRQSLDIETENVATARRIYTELKELFHIHPEVLVRKKMRLKKNNVYAVRVSIQMESVLDGLNLCATEPLRDQVSVPKNDRACCRRAYLRGAFLAAGSVNDPGSGSYHLEISTATEEQAAQILEVMNQFGLNAKYIQRKKGYIVYLKEGEKIVDFLSIIGAHQALLKFEDVRILKGMRNQVNRLVNCETANMNKAISAAVRQLEVIRYIDDAIGLEKLPAHLREVAELRIRFPEVNLQELSARLGHKVSKSGLNHRFRKLEEIAEKLRVKQ